MNTNTATEIANWRKSYERGELMESTAKSSPLDQFSAWLADAVAANEPEPSAMTLATVGSNMRPSTRVVLLKDYSEQGFVWFTNYQSRKGQELAGNPFAALQFHWVGLERVVRIEGTVQRVDEAVSQAYFDTRPLASRWGAIASAQSQVVAGGRAELEAAMAQVQQAEPDQPVKPVHWGGYCLVPDRYEFWQGRRNRLHDRLRYQRQAGQPTWRLERLAP